MCVAVFREERIVFIIIAGIIRLNDPAPNKKVTEEVWFETVQRLIDNFQNQQPEYQTGSHLFDERYNCRHL